MISDAATAAFYEREADRYAAQTAALDMFVDYSRFLPRVRRMGTILDAGCGSGRDTLAFLGCGFDVVAFDASARLCALSARLTGRPTLHRSFADVEEVDRYAGVWASASLLHLPPADRDDAWNRLVRSIESGGAMYASFKLGVGEVESADGRRFHLIEEEDLRGIVARSGLTDVDLVRSESIAGTADRWLSVVAIKPARSFG